MANVHATLVSLFDDCADAIREKDGTSAPIVADTFPQRIRAIPTESSSFNYIIGDGLKVEESEEGPILSVDTVDAAEEDNTRPITSKAVNVIVGNINVLLGTI